jgi:hypothetical protein
MKSKSKDSEENWNKIGQIRWVVGCANDVSLLGGNYKTIKINPWVLFG